MFRVAVDTNCDSQVSRWSTATRSQLHRQQRLLVDGADRVDRLATCVSPSRLVVARASQYVFASEERKSIPLGCPTVITMRTSSINTVTVWIPVRGTSPPSDDSKFMLFATPLDQDQAAPELQVFIWTDKGNSRLLSSWTLHMDHKTPQTVPHIFLDPCVVGADGLCVSGPYDPSSRNFFLEYPISSDHMSPTLQGVQTHQTGWNEVGDQLKLQVVCRVNRPICRFSVLAAFTYTRMFLLDGVPQEGWAFANSDTRHTGPVYLFFQAPHSPSCSIHISLTSNFGALTGIVQSDELSPHVFARLRAVYSNSTELIGIRAASATAAYSATVFANISHNPHWPAHGRFCVRLTEMGGDTANIQGTFPRSRGAHFKVVVASMYVCVFF
jgi:hypothetical protein